MKILTFDLSRIMAGTVAPSTIEDCVEAFRELGHEVTQIEPTILGETPQERLEGLKEEFRKTEPDFVFTLNDYCLTPELLTILKIPYVSWFGDNPFHVMENNYCSPYYTIFVWDWFYIKNLKEVGFENVYYLPYGSNPAVFKRVELSQEEEERYGCNISFAGSSFSSALKKYDEIVKDRDTKKLIDKIVEIQVEDPTLNISDILKAVEDASCCSISFKDTQHKKQVEIWLEYLAMAKYRQEIIGNLGSLGLNIYGDEGWREFLKGGDWNGIRFLGWANNRTDLTKIYNVSKINLNISKSQSRSALSMRIFDISCAGGFLVTDFRVTLPEFFILDKEVVCYRSKDEVRELVVYYLDHPQEREEIGRAAQKRILAEHTFRHRMGSLLATMVDKGRL